MYVSSLTSNSYAVTSKCWVKSLESQLMKRAKYHIMSQTVDVNTELLKWPIAPDGYIPNSVIRSWRKKGKNHTQMDCWDDIVYSVYPVDDQEDESKRVFWFKQDEEEEEKIDIVKRRKKEKKDEESEKDKDEKTEVEGKERVDEKKEKEEHKMDRIVLLKQPYDIQTKTTLQHQLKAFDDEEMNVEPQGQEVGLTCNSKKTVYSQPTSCHEYGPKQLREQREDKKLHETITPPLQYISVPNKQITPSFNPKEWPEPPVESPAVYADVVIPKREPRTTLYIPPREPQNLTPHPLKPPPPTPEDHQPKPDLGPPECSPIRDKRFLLSSTKYNNIRDQAQVPLDRKVLEIYKKFKVGTKIPSHLGKRSTITERGPASKATHSTVQANTGGVNLNGGLYSPPEFRSTLSNIQTQAPGVIHPECPGNLLCSDSPEQFAQTILPTNHQRGYKSMPEWRKSLYKLIALQGFCSPHAARLAAKEHPVKSSNASSAGVESGKARLSNARQLVASMPSLQPGQAAAHQRVVQKIWMEDTIEPASFHFQHVIPMTSRQSFFTLNPCGKTQYGRLQFDWMRGHDEDKLQSVCS